MHYVIMADTMLPANSGIFTAPEIGDFSKNSVIFQLAKMGSFMEHLYALIGLLKL